MLSWIGRRKEASKRDLSSQLRLSVVLQSSTFFPGDCVRGIGFVFIDEDFSQWLGSEAPQSSIPGKRKSSTPPMVTALTLKLCGLQSSSMGLLSRETVYYQQDVVLFQRDAGDSLHNASSTQQHIDVSVAAMMDHKAEAMRRVVRGEGSDGASVLNEKGSYLFPFQVQLPSLLPWSNTVPTPPLSNVSSHVNYYATLTLSLTHDKQFSSDKCPFEILPLPIPLWRWVAADAKSACLPPLGERHLIALTMLPPAENDGAAEQEEGEGRSEKKRRHRHRTGSRKDSEQQQQKEEGGKRGTSRSHRGHRHRTSGRHSSSPKHAAQRSFIVEAPPLPVEEKDIPKVPITIQPFQKDYTLSIRTSLMQKVKLTIPIQLSSIILTPGGGTLVVELTLDGSKDENMKLLHHVSAKLIIDAELGLFQKFIFSTVYSTETSNVFDISSNAPRKEILKIPVPSTLPLSVITSDLRLETQLVLRFFVDSTLRKFNASIIIPVTVVRNMDRVSLVSRRMSYWTNNFDGQHIPSKRLEQYQTIFPVIKQAQRRLVVKSAELLDMLISHATSPVPSVTSTPPPSEKVDDLACTYEKLAAATSASLTDVVFIPLEDPTAQNGSFELNPFQQLGSPTSVSVR